MCHMFSSNPCVSSSMFSSDLTVRCARAMSLCAWPKQARNMSRWPRSSTAARHSASAAHRCCSTSSAARRCAASAASARCSNRRSSVATFLCSSKCASRDCRSSSCLSHARASAVALASCSFRSPSVFVNVRSNEWKALLCKIETEFRGVQTDIDTHVPLDGARRRFPREARVSLPQSGVDEPRRSVSWPAFRVHASPASLSSRRHSLSLCLP